MENVWELLEWLQKIIQAKPGLSVSDGINKLILFDILDNSVKQNQDALNLMTLHAAKGLEFPFVYLIGVEENILPHQVSIENDEVEEERRLAYVGITRAQKTLTLTLSQKRKQGQTLQTTTPSRFLDELPPDILEWHGLKTATSPEKSKKIANLHLAGLKSMLEQN
jgi:ATP-dependent DNA helicase Rep